VVAYFFPGNAYVHRAVLVVVSLLSVCLSVRRSVCDDVPLAYRLGYFESNYANNMLIVLFALQSRRQHRRSKVLSGRVFTARNKRDF